MSQERWYTGSTLSEGSLDVLRQLPVYVAGNSSPHDPQYIDAASARFVAAEPTDHLLLSDDFIRSPSGVLSLSFRPPSAAQCPSLVSCLDLSASRCACMRLFAYGRMCVMTADTLEHRTQKLAKRRIVIWVQNQNAQFPKKSYPCIAEIAVRGHTLSSQMFSRCGHSFSKYHPGPHPPPSLSIHARACAGGCIRTSKGGLPLIP